MPTPSKAANRIDLDRSLLAVPKLIGRLFELVKLSATRDQTETVSAAVRYGCSANHDHFIGSPPIKRRDSVPLPRAIQIPIHVIQPHLRVKTMDQRFQLLLSFILGALFASWNGLGMQGQDKNNDRFAAIQTVSCPSREELCAPVGKGGLEVTGQVLPPTVPATCNSDSNNNNNQLSLFEEEGPEHNPLWKFANSHKTGPGLHKWTAYFDAYHRHFNRYRKQPEVVLVEIGVQSGGSIVMWQNYFGKSKLKYFGVDINKKTLKFKDKLGVDVTIADQGNRTFWREFYERIPRPDIIIDDGGHRMWQQLATLEESLPVLKEGGTFLAEDLHTSYQKRFGGGYKKKGTFNELVKDFIDYMNAWWSEDLANFKVG